MFGPRHSYAAYCTHPAGNHELCLGRTRIVVLERSSIMALNVRGCCGHVRVKATAATLLLTTVAPMSEDATNICRNVLRDTALGPAMLDAFISSQYVPKPWCPFHGSSVRSKASNFVPPMYTTILISCHNTIQWSYQPVSYGVGWTPFGIATYIAHHNLLPSP